MKHLRTETWRLGGLRFWNIQRDLLRDLASTGLFVMGKICLILMPGLEFSR